MLHLFFLSKSLPFVTRITSALAENCKGSLHLLDPATVAATAAFLLPVQGLVGLQGEVPKIACLISKTTNIRAKVSAEINQEMGELRTTVRQNRATIDYLLLKHHLGC